MLKSARALQSVENARRTLDRASEARERAKGASEGRGGEGKENGAAADARGGDAAADAAVLGEDVERVLRVSDVNVSIEDSARSEASMEGGDDVERRLEQSVADVVCDWLGDVDSVCAEADRACGVNLQALYAPLRGDETLERLRGDKSALKRRLRRFDVRVFVTTGRKTTREDKRHLKPLYIRLAKIKDLIAIREAGG